MTTPSLTRANGAPDISILLPVAALVGSIASLCLGTSFAKQLFPAIGAEGVTALRVTIAALLLSAIWRPWRARLSLRDWRAVALYGAVLGTMNLLFYKSLETIPLGIAIAIEFSGPLGVALISSRRALDLVWIALAVVGLGLLLPLGHGAAALDPLGVGYALAAAVCWALYIVCGARLGHLHGGRTVALGLTVAALVALPVGVAKAGAALFEPALLAVALGVAVLSSAIPYSLEMFALNRMPKRTFGVLLSLEPAVGSLAGLAILGERLSLAEWFAVACIMAASAGAAASARRPKPASATAEPRPAEE